MLQKLCCSERVGYTTAWPCFFLPPKMRILRIVNLYEASAMGAFKGSNLLAGVSLVRIAHPRNMVLTRRPGKKVNWKKNVAKNMNDGWKDSKGVKEILTNAACWKTLYS